ncbi:MAG TPA: PIN domain-containing protein [Mucilaginibacter sp.]
MRIYLDNCCFNRPFDNQLSIRVKLETDAKLYVQALIRANKLELSWSYILDFENSANPFEERKYTIEKWKSISVIDVSENDEILQKATTFVKQGVKVKDALHLACAIESGCQYLLTTDDLFRKKAQNNEWIKVLNPIEFIPIIEEL